MAIIISYPSAGTVTTSDNLLGTQFDAESGANITKNFSVAKIIALANGVMPTLQEVTTEGNTTTDTIIINKADTEQALLISGDAATNGLIHVSAGNDGPCIKADANDGSSVYATNMSGTAIIATTVEGTAISAVSTTVDGLALRVNGFSRGISVNNGGIKIQGVVHDDTTYQLSLSANSAAKPSTNTWTITSDERVKTNVNPYTKGLEAVLAINPITYDYNGKAGFDSANTGNIGIIAQDVLSIIPEAINTYNAILNEDDKEKTELYNFDSHSLTFILINAVKELSAKVDALELQIVELKTK